MTGLRGARSQIQGRFESVARDPFDDGWAADDGDAPAAPEPEVEDGPGMPRGWSAARIDLVQRLFGPGWHRPGGIDALLGPLKLGEGSAVLVLGAGLDPPRHNACHTQLLAMSRSHCA